MKQTVSLRDEAGSYDATVYNEGSSMRTVLFAAGRGGNPERHQGLLGARAAHGCTVIAPNFEMTEPVPTRADLVSRMRRAELAMNAFAHPDAPVVGIGHSIGTTMLLLLAGVEGWTKAREHMLFAGTIDFDKLLLLAPALDFFPSPRALSPIRARVGFWLGGEDRMVPLEKVMQLKDNARAEQQVDIFLDQQAGHFTFMDEPPPNVAEPHPERAAFLTGLSNHICWFATAQ